MGDFKDLVFVSHKSLSFFGDRAMNAQTLFNFFDKLFWGGARRSMASSPFECKGVGNSTAPLVTYFELFLKIFPRL